MQDLMYSLYSNLGSHQRKEHPVFQTQSVNIYIGACLCIRSCARCMLLALMKLLFQQEQEVGKAFQAEGTACKKSMTLD